MNKIKSIFLWLITIIGLVLTLMGSVQFLNLGLKQYIFTKADYNYCRVAPIAEPNGKAVINSDYQTQCEEQNISNKQSQAASATAELIVGLPLFLYFLRLARKD